MRAITLIGVLAALAGDVAAQVPTLTVRDVRGNEMPLRLEAVEVEVRFMADVAETTIELAFRNETNRLLEGEFVMPLPEGATVSSYALEVQGAMREAVAVEKERARFAYESIKRQMIDPGLVEREAGNVYRTRIFPIPRKGVKRVRVGYVEHLPRADDALRYELPLRHDGPINHFSCTIQHFDKRAVTLHETAGLKFVEDRDGVLKTEARNAVLKERLRATVPTPQKGAIHLEAAPEDRAWFYLTDEFPEGLAAQDRPAPEAVRLVWDASESGLERDREREFALLDAWFKKLGKTNVRVQVLRTRCEEAGFFAVENGDWAELREVLEGVLHDGVADFEQLNLTEDGEDFLLLVTDGVAPYSRVPRVSRPFFVIDSAPSVPKRELRAVAEEGGGAWIDLGPQDVDAALETLTRERPGVVSIVGAALGRSAVDTSGVAGSPVRIYGLAAARKFGENIGVTYGVRGGRTVSRTISLQNVERDRSGGIVRKLWAQRRLAEWERAGTVDDEEIVAHCKEHKLVSDYTSLIVLERMEDHVRYEIPPPEPELLAVYQRGIDTKRAEPATGWRRLVREWNDRLAWHRREFPWGDVVLAPRLQQVTIWVDAVKEAFKEGEYDAESFGAIDAWRRSALAVIERKDEVRTGAAYKEWFRRVGELAAEGATLRELPVALPAEGPVTVSVRGLVNEPGNVAGEPGLTLRQAVKKAGGVAPLGSHSHVELYRKAGKTIYNVLSKHYEDVELRPGDMVVVKEYFWDHWEDDAGVDPFGGEENAPSDPRDGPAVVGDADLWIDESGSGDLGAGPFGGAEKESAWEPRAPDLPVEGTIEVAAQGGGQSPALAEFDRALKGGADAAEAYRALKAGRRHPTAFYIDAARVLFAHGHAGMGGQALRNLLETPDVRLDRLLTCALWFEEFGHRESAAELLRLGMKLAPEVPLLRYHLARIAARDGRGPEAAQHLATVVRESREDDATAAAIALTDLCGIEAAEEVENSPLGALTREGAPDLNGNLDADLRIVITSSQPEYRLHMIVEEPSGHTCRYESPCGGKLTSTKGISEYMMRRALPGRYVLKCSSAVTLTVHASLYRNWGRPDQRRDDLTIRIEGGSGLAELATYEFEFVE